MYPPMIESLRGLLCPRSIVIVGASADPNKVSGRPIRNLLRDGYEGRIHLVNPNYREIAGLPCHAEVASLPEVPELGIVALAAERAAAAVDALGVKGVRFAIVWSSGFGEMGDKGRALEANLLAVARRHGMRLCGPNTLGLTNAFERMPLTFSQYADSPLTPGPVAFVSQSGAFGTAVATAARSRGIGLGYFVSTGNQADITVAGVVDAILDDDRIRVVVAYLEGLVDGLEFLAAAEKARRMGKPLIVVKVGRQAAGRRAAVSHTGSLAGDDAIFDSLAQQAGVIRAQDEMHALDLTAAFVSCRPAQHKGVGFITISGGAGAMMADLAEESGLEVPVLGEATQHSLAAVLRGFAALGNPVDVTGQVVEDVSILARSLAVLQADPSIAVVVIWAQLLHAKAEQLADELIAASRANEKPFVLCWLNPHATAMQRLRAAGVCVVETTRGAVQAAAGLVRFGEALRHAPDTAAGRAASNRQVAPSEAEPAAIPTLQAAALLSKHGLRLVDSRLARSADEAVALARELGHPVALKIESPDLPHKTEAGGVRLNLQDDATVRSAFAEVMAAARAFDRQARLDGVLVQKMAVPGTELVLGLERDPAFGPVVMVGLGGIFIEVLRDAVFGVPPLSQADALGMVGRLRSQQVLQGVRGQEPVDTGALAEAICAISRLAMAHPEITELDVNPVFAGRGGITAVDWLMLGATGV